MLKFDADRVSRELIMIKYFQKGLKPFIQAEINHRGRKLDSFKDTMQKTVNVEAKVSFWPHSVACETDQYCPWGTRPANFIAAKSQSSPMKDPRVEKPRAWTQKATLLHYSKSTEISEKAWKEKKKK